MSTYRQLCGKAKELGHDLTPTLKDELRMLATVPDKDIRKAHRKLVVECLARDFQVTIGTMEVRLEKLNK